MRKIVAVLVTVGLVAGVASASSVDTTGSWNGSDGVYYWGEPNTATYGQTFTVGADTVLNSFSFFLQQDGSSATNFAAYVYAWDSANSRATGSALWSSASSTDNNEGSGGFDEIGFNTGSLSLTNGGEYVAFFSITGYEDSDYNDYHAWGHTRTDAQAGGEFVFINNGNDASQWTSSAWTLNWYGPGTDLAYTMNFSPGNVVPAPASMLLAVLGLGVSAFKRNRA